MIPSINADGISSGKCKMRLFSIKKNKIKISISQLIHIMQKVVQSFQPMYKKYNYTIVLMLFNSCSLCVTVWVQNLYVPN